MRIIVDCHLLVVEDNLDSREDSDNERKVFAEIE